MRSTERSDPTGDLAHAAWLGVDQEKDAEDTVQSLSGDSWDWMIVDHYALDARWESAVRRAVGGTMVIDDLADRTHDCELLLDQNFVADMSTRYTDKVTPSCKLLLGPRYALLHSSYARMHESVAPRAAVNRILIYFGGVDLDDLTCRTLQVVLAAVSSTVEIDVVMPVDSAASEKIALLARGHERVSCHRDLATLAHLIASADLSIGAMGATTWERLCLGLPTVAITTARNQDEVAAALNNADLVVWLGDSAAATPDLIESHLIRILGTNSLSSWSNNCKQLCDGRGTARVVRNLYKRIEDS